MEAFQDLTQELEAKRAELKRELAEAQGLVAELEADLMKVDDALGALTGAPKKPKKKAKGRTTKSRAKKKADPAPAAEPAAPLPVQERALTLDEVRGHLDAAMQEHFFADAHELEGEVRSRMEGTGVSLEGFHDLFAEALASHHAQGIEGDPYGA